LEAFTEELSSDDAEEVSTDSDLSGSDYNSNSDSDDSNASSGDEISVARQSKQSLVAAGRSGSGVFNDQSRSSALSKEPRVRHSLAFARAQVASPARKSANSPAPGRPSKMGWQAVRQNKLHVQGHDAHHQDMAFGRRTSAPKRSQQMQRSAKTVRIGSPKAVQSPGSRSTQLSAKAARIGSPKAVQSTGSRSTLM
jgi:hypothetical protein